MPGYFGRVAGTKVFAGAAFATPGTIKNMLVHFRRERNMPGPPLAVPGTAKCAGTFSPGTQHAGTAFVGTRYSKMCRYFFAGDVIIRKVMRMKITS